MEASRSKQTEAFGTGLAQAAARKEAHKREVERLGQVLLDLHGRKAEAEGLLRSERKYVAILEERDTRAARLGLAREEIKECTASLQAAMRDAWRTVLAGPVQVAIDLASKEAGEQLDRVAADLRRRAVASGHCGTCDRDLDDATARRLEVTLGTAPDGTGVAPAVTRLVDLNKFRSTDVTALVGRLSSQLGRLRVEVIELQDRLRDLDTELGDADTERLRGGTVSLSDTIRKITVTEAALDAEEREVANLEANIKKLSEQLARIAPANLRGSQARSALLRAAGEVFSQSVEGYKSDLRQRVQATASDLFLRMTTEDSEYARLEITDNYGLNIVHRDTAVEEGRSAGAEHVVALALVGALQANAPLRGPIVMDSPFGRLDEGHTENVVAALPTMADQVVLLVHEAELRRNNVRRILGSKLLREYELVKVSARRTRIDAVR